ncbi:NUDIX hydrolase [Streptomyces sp. NPDC052042]|uniref:NUDIX hydrolase n=1 Tax=Streptomyces sp. NPDC052042 TaxID=3365683 RepID=UPI0037CD09C0
MPQQNTEEQPGIAVAIVVHEGRVLMVGRRIGEGQLSWQFPAGEVGPGETCEDAAVREVREETGLNVAPAKLLGKRAHPQTGRRMCYTACEVVGGTARIADPEELAELVWVTHGDIPQYVPHGLFEVVQEYLDAALHP